MASFRLRVGGGATKTFELNDGDVVGRIRGVEITLPHESVSRQHARVHLSDGRVEIEDLSSSNGTFVNDHKIIRKGLNRGDRVRFGKVVLDFLEAAEDGAAPSEPEVKEGQPEVRDELGEDDWALDGDYEIFLSGDEAAAPAPPAPTPTAPLPSSPSRPIAAAAAPSAAEPRIEVRARGPAEESEGPAPEVGSTQRILQYRRVENRMGVLGQDLAQWTPLQKFGAFVVVLILCAGLFYLARMLGAGLGG